MKSDNLLHKWGFVDSQSKTIVNEFFCKTFGQPCVEMCSTYVYYDQQKSITLSPVKSTIEVARFVHFLAC